MVGIDIIKISRFKKIKKDNYSLWQKFFTEGEWEYAFRYKNSYEKLAGIFAAKEAVIKLGIMNNGELYRNIEILHYESGAPYVRLSNQDSDTISISVSHDAGVAVAVAINYE